VHICYSHQVTVDGITIRNNSGGRGPSTDGIDVDSSSHVLVEHCDISTTTTPSVSSPAAGFTIGSETSGGIRNVRVENITVLKAVLKGIYFKSAKTRGGTIQNIVITDMHM